MLTKTPKVGDEVLIVQKYGKGDRKIGFCSVDKVSRQYLTTTIYCRPIKFKLDGQNIDYEMFDNQEAYEKSLQRDRNLIEGS